MNNEFSRRAALKTLIAGGAYWALPTKPARADMARMTFGPAIRYMPQWQAFYHKHPELVAADRVRPRLNMADWARMGRIVQRQNHPYQAETRGDDWRLLEPGEPGDCEKLALTLMRDLVRDSFPLGAIRPLISGPRCLAHMTLRLTTADGDFVILPQQKSIVRWTDLGWDWHSCHAIGSEWWLYSGGVA